MENMKNYDNYLGPKTEQMISVRIRSESPSETDTIFFADNFADTDSDIY